LRVHAPSPLSSPPRGRGQGEGAAVSNSISTAKLNKTSLLAINYVTWCFS